MKFTIEYIPLNKIKPDLSLKITKHMKKLQRLMWDCMMYVLVVKKIARMAAISLLAVKNDSKPLKNTPKIFMRHVS